MKKKNSYCSFYHIASTEHAIQGKVAKPFVHRLIMMTVPQYNIIKWLKYLVGWQYWVCSKHLHTHTRAFII